MAGAGIADEVGTRERAPASAGAGAGAGSRRRRAARRRPRRVAYLYLLPALTLYSLFLLVPLGYAVWLSLYQWDGLSTGVWVGLRNYTDALTDPALRSAFGHSLILIGFYAVLPVTFGLLLAGIMARAPNLRFLSGFRTVLFLPQVVASVVVGTVWGMMLAPEGVVNSVLGGVGLGGRNWLGDFGTALPAVGVIGTWTQIGLCLVLFLAGIGKIPSELFDAARMDGANALQEFFAVTLPGLRYQVVVALVLTTTAALRNFDVIYITTRGGPGTATTVPAFEVYHRAFELNAVGSASAVGLMLAVVIGILVAVINKLGGGD